MDVKLKNKKTAIIQIANALVWATIIILYALEKEGSINSSLSLFLIIGAGIQTSMLNLAINKQK